MKQILAHLFTPHRSNNHRPHLLHPSSIAVLVALVLFTNSSLELVKAAPPRGLVLGYASNINTSQVLEATNRKRLLHGLRPLSLNPLLTQAAKEKANHMFAIDYWAHIGPEGTTPWKFIKQTGYQYSVAGENLARDFDITQTMVEAWMDSPTHKANIIHPKYQDTGIAVVNGKLDGVETTLVVQMFGMPATTLSSAEATPSITPTATTNAPPVPQVAAAQTQFPNTNSDSITVSPLSLKKTLSLSMLLLIITVIIVDEIIIRKKQVVRFVGKNIAHLSFLTLAVVLVITLSYPGGIL